MRNTLLFVVFLFCVIVPGLVFSIPATVGIVTALGVVKVLVLTICTIAGIISARAMQLG